jgi:hypothetical protein
VEKPKDIRDDWNQTTGARLQPSNSCGFQCGLLMGDAIVSRSVVAGDADRAARAMCPDGLFDGIKIRSSSNDRVPVKLMEIQGPFPEGNKDLGFR